MQFKISTILLLSGKVSAKINLYHFAIPEGLRIWDSMLEHGSLPHDFGSSGKGETPMADAAKTKELTEQERKEQIEYHLAELKKLRATPRSDWHAGFEALLRIETHKYADLVHISTEEEIGEVPPRTDFVILVEDEQVEWEKAIFRIFRKINILDYKNPYDALNRRVIRKVCGYVNLYIDVAEHEGDRPEDQVTIYIFRAVKNPQLFEEIEKRRYARQGRDTGNLPCERIYRSTLPDHHHR